MSIPNDAAMLLSYVNTQLRDHYSSFEDLCKSLSLDAESIITKLKSIDYSYDEKLNQFI